MISSKLAVPTLRDYHIIQPLGAGAYSTVWKGQHKQTGHLVALKQVTLEDNLTSVPLVGREAALLRSMSHPNVIRLIDTVDTLSSSRSGGVFLVFAYADLELSVWLKQLGRGPRPGTASHFQAKGLMQQLLKGIEYCHANGIVHRDLKPANVLVDRDGMLRVADFGQAKSHGIEVNGFTPGVGTIVYRAPEMFVGVLDLNATPAGDLWAVGCCMITMYSGDIPFDDSGVGKDRLRSFFISQVSWVGSPGADILQKVLPQGVHPKIFLPPDPISPRPWTRLCPEMSRPTQNLLSRLLAVMPWERLSAGDALLHAYFRTASAPPASSESVTRREKSRSWGLGGR